MISARSILAKRFEIAARSSAGADRFVLREGTPADYAHLACFHYRAGAPATFARVLALVDPAPNAKAEHGAPVGVLVASYPVLNAPWRERLWPDLFEPEDRAERAARLNASVRTISRVVIDPRFRALGLACRLIRSYLAAPLTERTEALAVMGALAPVFVRAGMSEHRFPVPARDQALLRVLARMRLSPWRLACPGALRLTSANRRVLESELRRWANNSRATRGLIDAPFAELCRVGASVSSHQIVYTHEQHPSS